MRGGWHRARLIAIWVAALIVAVVVIGAVAIYESLPHHELPANFDFHGDKISAARGSATAALGAQLDAFERFAGADHVGARSRTDLCEEGQDNFERQDTYAYSCRIEMTELVPVAEPFAANAAALAEALVPGDCPNGTDAEHALADPASRPEDL